MSLEKTLLFTSLRFSETLFAIIKSLLSLKSFKDFITFELKIHFHDNEVQKL